MGEQTTPRIKHLTAKSPEEKLDELNAQLRRHPRTLRRVIEADLESKAKGRRKAEPSVSSSVKGGGET